MMCKKCSGNMVLRSGPNGKFYGCSNYPECRYTQNLDKARNVHQQKEHDLSSISRTAGPKTCVEKEHEVSAFTKKTIECYVQNFPTKEEALEHEKTVDKKMYETFVRPLEDWWQVEAVLK